MVKDVFKDHFETRFKQHAHGRLKLNISFPNRLSTDQVADMDRSVSQDEICVAVWNYGKNKSPGPDDGSFPKGSNSSFIVLIPKVTDFRPISLIGCVYKVVTKILANRLAMVISDLVFDIQSAFVANRQILDGPFILNDLLAWCKRKKKQAMIFKVDFAKAYDSVRWDYLLDVLQAFGFGHNWGKWIRGTFSFAMASILVNGSPTFEFPFFCRLKQGDLLAPYLFILIMESLHISFSRATSDGLFKASLIGCAVMKNHFRYLGVMVGDSMSRKLAWADTVQKLRSWFSKWTIKTLSIGAIRCKFFDGADPAERKITWVFWDKVLASKKNGGLGVSSFHALNPALLLKYIADVAASFQRSQIHNIKLSMSNHYLGRLICRWWDLDWHDLLSFSDWNAWFSAIRLPSRIKLIFERVFYVAWWHLWVYRNQYIFAATPPRRSVIFDDIVLRSFIWTKFRKNKLVGSAGVSLDENKVCGFRRTLELVAEKSGTSWKSVNFCTLYTLAGNGMDVYVSKESVCVVNERLNNIVYGFFLGKHYPIVENYVKNTWGKFSLVKSMMIEDMFFFKFRSRDEMEAMLENDELSAIATKLGKPLMSDSYAAAMCIDSYGRASYARAMVELRADVELSDTIVVVVPKFIGEGYTMNTIHVEQTLNEKLVLVDDDEKPLEIEEFRGDYGRDTLKLEDVLATLNFKELHLIMEAKGDGGEGLSYICQSEEHLKMDFPRYNRNKSHDFVKNKDHTSNSKAYGYENAHVTMVLSVGQLLDWIMDSWGSYHITYMRDYLVYFRVYDGVNVFLGDGRECHALFKKDLTMKTQSGRIKEDIEGEVTGHLGVRGIQLKNRLVDETNVTLLAKGRSSAYSWDTVKVWMVISFGGYMTLLQRRVKFEVEQQKDQAFEVEPQGNVDQGVSLQEGVISKWKAGLEEEMCVCSITIIRKVVTATTISTRSMHETNEDVFVYFDYDVDRSITVMVDLSYSTGFLIQECAVSDGKLC
nr:RNA-directed DNA polymerase, eukaryota, reverse transcriptase zinc-binding domain protein [Tanacetum cinerariifolium]